MTTDSGPSGCRTGQRTQAVSGSVSSSIPTGPGSSTLFPNGTVTTFVGQGEWAGADGALMVVEVTSNDDDTDRRDRVAKPRAYAETSIPVCLLIDRDTGEVKVHSLPDGVQYEQLAAGSQSSVGAGVALAVGLDPQTLLRMEPQTLISLHTQTGHRSTIRPWTVHRSSTTLTTVSPGSVTLSGLRGTALPPPGFTCPASTRLP